MNKLFGVGFLAVGIAVYLSQPAPIKPAVKTITPVVDREPLDLTTKSWVIKETSWNGKFWEVLMVCPETGEVMLDKRMYGGKQ